MSGPNTLVRRFNIAAPGANTNILTTGIAPVTSGAFRVTVVLTTSSVFNVTCTAGGTTFTWGLNGSTPLNAGDLYAFTFGAVPSALVAAETSLTALTYNFRVETNSVIEYLQVDEIQTAVL